ncbi:putative bifunctional diguanylate cyclase/phosphodiesterase [Rhizobium paknamense]|uniref:Diguanylate cyclase (GGDEF)-like protein n=2 Tax=Rhizobium paknamense TaxID=1206817 RepID=A0ABU0ID20_9HYPH|nr:EAL domain-containing protein [Rhizobium paknamense]MDQ0455330.1 diguanylate cyclase (GGDEF)-like protein [Rhizobium paknamense]
MREALLLLAIGVLLLVFGTRIQFHERLDRFLHAHEEWQLDEIFTAFNIVGVFGLIYAWRRILDLKREIARRNRAEENIDWLAHHDPLTLLPNRRALEKAGLAGKQPAHGYAVYSIDLDGFKRVNDLVGHHGGDLLLKEVAHRLNTLFTGALPYRLGGDEFLLIAERHPGMDCLRFGHKILRCLSAPYDVGGMTSEIGASIGFALYPEDSADFNDAVHCADVAMYVAKKSGRNSVFAFEKIMEDRVMRRAETEMALKRAIRNDSIVPYYQPLIDLRSGEIRGFEALARWEAGPNHIIPPSDFIELAEDAGLIVELSERLLRAACRDAMAWPDSIRLAFNISPIQLSDRQMGLRIMNVLMETGLPPQRLEIEITETALVRDMDSATAILGELQAAGIKIALDDFGTGYSSLSQLSKFRFDKIKIDRSFVTGFETDKKREDIVRAILGLGQGLGISTTAEGIEEDHQLDFLKSIGCDFGQGYLFGKPVSADETRQLLEHRGSAASAMDSSAA